MGNTIRGSVVSTVKSQDHVIILNVCLKNQPISADLFGLYETKHVYMFGVYENIVPYVA